MFGKIAAFEFRYQLRQPVFWVVVALFGLMCFLTMATDIIRLSFGVNVHKNAPYSLAQTQLIFGLLYMFVTTAFVANVVVRDDDTGFGPLIRTTRVTKFDYLIGRFTGAFGAAIVSFAAIPLALLVGSLMPWMDREVLGPLDLGDYLYSFVLLGVPSLFVTSALFFAVATITRSMMWTYVCVVGFLVLQFAIGLVLGKPEVETLAALLDPFGLNAFELATRYWTVAEMNTANPPLAGLLLWNRLLWLGFSFAMLALAYGLFRFGGGQLRGRRLKAARLAERAAVDTAPPPPPSGPLPRPVFSARTSLLQLWTRTRLDMGQVFLSPSYFVLLVIGIFFAAFALWTVTTDGTYGGAVYPVTRLMIERLGTSFVLIPMIVSIYYAGELVWRERERKTNELIESSAVPSWAFVLPKVLAISLVLISTLFAGVVVALLVQVFRGYYVFEFDKYLLWLILPQSVDFILLAVLAVFTQVLSPNKFLGWGIMVVYTILVWTAVSTGFDHNLYLYGGVPSFGLSDMNGQGSFWIGAWWFRLYWSLCAVMLTVLSYAIWQRGAELRLRPRLLALPRALRGAAGALFLVAFAGMAVTGVWIFINTNVWNTYRNHKDEDAWRAGYERHVVNHNYLDLPRPKIESMKLEVKLYPHDQRAETWGQYVVQNRTGTTLREIILVFPRDLKVIDSSVQDGRPIKSDSEYNYRIFTLDRPMLAGERRTVSFTTERARRGFRNDGGDTRLVGNGTFLDNSEITPALGFERSTFLDGRKKRRDQKLDGDNRPAALDDPAADQFNYLRHDADFMMADISVETDADQTPVAPGRKILELVDGDRRRARFVTEAPVLPFFSVQSARYDVASERYKGIDLSIFYHPAHSWNVPRMNAAMKASLDYCQTNFSAYQFKELRFIEYPAYAESAQAFAGTIPWSEGLFFIADYRDTSKIDMVTYVGAHEIGHQWWAHQIIGADKQGATALSETLAQYTALMVMKRMYGEDQIRKFLKFELNRYLRARGGDPADEQPLLKVESQPYIYYNKGSLVMYRLQHEIGEARVNRALRRLLVAHGFKGAPYPTSRDLVAALLAEAPEKRALISDLFDRITLYDLQTRSMTVKKRADGRYDVSLTIQARKMYATGQGKETDSPMDEVLDVGLFTAMPGDENFTSANVVALVKRPIRSGTQTLTFVVDRAPRYAGVDPYNIVIDRNSDDNVTKAGR